MDKFHSLRRKRFGTNAEQQYLKQFTNYSIDEAQSKFTRCSCELVVRCVPKFFGTYAQNEEHDMKSVIEILKSADKEFQSLKYFMLRDIQVKKIR